MPYRLLKAFHKIQQRLVRELEKKFSGKDVVIIANRRIMRPQTSGQSNKRPRSRTLTAVRLYILCSWLQVVAARLADPKARSRRCRPLVDAAAARPVPPLIVSRQAR